MALRRILPLLALALALVVALVLYRAAFPGKSAQQVEAAPLPGVSFDRDAAVARFAAGLRLPTISWGGGANLDVEAFTALREHLRTSFPRVHGALQVEHVKDWTLLLTWSGSDPALDPLVLMAHQDVVPIVEESREDWVQPPFSGAVEEGVVWGRGAIDDKASLFAILEATEALLGAGFKPTRTVIFIFGHDEEIGGSGAGGAADLLFERGIRPFMVLDEGGGVTQGLLPGIEFPLALVGVAEKGYVTLELVVRGAGGHSSMPPKDPAIAVLGGALRRLQDHPLPTHFDDLPAALIESISPRLSFGYRIVTENLWLFGPAVEFGFTQLPSAAAMVRTTTAPTMLRGSVKENVLPAEAAAMVNFRVHPADRTGDVAEHAREVIDDERVEIRTGTNTEPSPVAPSEGAGWNVLRESIEASFPDSAVAPFLVVGGTDARYFRRREIPSYGFLPVVLDREAMRIFHGVNERLPVPQFEAAIGFYADFLRRAATAAGS